MWSTLAVLLLACLGVGNTNDFNVTNVLNSLLAGYDKRIRPNWGGSPVEVGITMYFISIFEISTKKQTVQTDFYFREKWTDPRLTFTAPPGKEQIALGSDAINSFWVPDSFIPDGASNFDHENQAFFRIQSDGTAFKAVRVWAQVNFPMDLTYFPKDQQIFSLKIESYGYTAKDIVYSWAKGQQSVGYSSRAGSSEVQILGVTVHSNTLTLTVGNYSRLTVDVHCARSHGHYVKQFYLPSVILFSMTWSSFFLSVSSIVRVLFLLASLLAELNLLGEAWTYLPEIAYSTMLEHYLFFGLVMTALAILEYVLVLRWYQQVRKVESVESDVELNLADESARKPESGEEGSFRLQGSYVTRITRYVLSFSQILEKHEKMDLGFRVAYPVIFVVYNMWYWSAFP